MKTYSSKYCVSLNVKIAGGGYMHVSFSPMTGGGSRYCTGDLAVQEALERHPKFGRLFSLDGAEKTHGPAAEPQGTVVKGKEDGRAERTGGRKGREDGKDGRTGKGRTGGERRLRV